MCELIGNGVYYNSEIFINCYIYRHNFNKLTATCTSGGTNVLLFEQLIEHVAVDVFRTVDRNTSVEHSIGELEMRL